MNENNHEEDLRIHTAIAALKLVDDPEVGLNIVDLGLVYQIDFDDEDKKIKCLMTLTTEFCPMGETITSNTKEALLQSFPDFSVDLTLTFDPAWNMTMISEEGREFLGG